MSVRRGSGRICKQTIKCELSSLSAWLFIGLLHPRLSCCGVHRFTLLCNHFSQVSFLHSLPSAGVALKTVCSVHKTQRSHSSASLLQIQLKNSTDIHQIQRIRVVRTRMLSLLQRMLRKLNHIMTTFNRQEDLQHLQSTLLQTTDVFSLYARYWHVYKRCHVTLTLNVYEEIFNPQSWAVNPDSDTYSSYRMRDVELWDSWQEDVYTPLTRLSTVEYLKEIYCQFKHNLVKRDLIF